MNELKKSDIVEFYENTDEIWNPEDLWHMYTYRNIRGFLFKHLSNYSEKVKVANIGSAGNTYGLMFDMYHSDIVNCKDQDIRNFVIASAEKLPYANNSFDISICVGSVINYCNADQVISELSRITQSGGRVILEYESSYSFNFFKKEQYKRNVILYNATYQKDSNHLIWVYSPKYISNLLEVYGFKIIRTSNFHIISSLVERITKNDQLASRFTRLDLILKYVPYFKNRSHNRIVLCQKK